MAASRARWLVTASRTGRGGKAAPALLKWRTFATPGVSDLSDGTSSVNVTSSALPPCGLRDDPVHRFVNHTRLEDLPTGRSSIGGTASGSYARSRIVRPIAAV